MKRTPLLITIGIIALIAGGLFAYQKFFRPQKLTPWDLIPSGAVAVYEASTCQECIEPVKATSIWQIIMKAALHNKNRDSLQNIVSLLNNQKPGTLVSLHVTRKDDFDFIFYLPLTDQNERLLVEANVADWSGKPNIRTAQRTFNAATIHELSSADATFSWTLLDNVWIGSFTPFLIEDVIRVFGSDDRSTFRQRLGSIYQMPKLKNDAGNLYIHLQNFSRWLSVFSPEINADLIRHFGRAAVLDIKAAQKNLVLNGFSIEEGSAGSVLTVFRDQFPTSFDIKQYVSNRTVFLATYGISEGLDFGVRLSRYPERRKVLEDTLIQLARTLNVNLRDLYTAVDNEVGVCYVESSRNDLSRVLIVETESPDTWMSTLNRMASRFSVDTVFFEPFGDYEIRELPVFRFPEKLFAPFVNGFDHSYYTVVGNTILIGEDLEELKAFLEDIEQEETWGKSVAQNRFLESTLLESNVSLYINTPRIWNILRGSLNEKWVTFIRDNRSLLSSVGMGAIQFSHLNESFYTNVAWQYEPYEPRTPTPRQEQMLVTTFHAPLRGHPFVVRSHVDRSLEVLVQDSLNHIHLVSSTGNALWSKQMEGPIIGELFQVDYYKNGKLQYLFATEGKLHIIDRLGNYVPPFPVDVPAKDIEYLSLVDYDHSKNYRFLITDKSGKIWMFDKQGTNLEGWTPNNVEDNLFTSARHHRIRGRDYLIAIRRDGRAYLKNRRGEMQRGFPLNLDARPAGDYFLEVGSTIDKSDFILVSSDGFKIRFNPAGKIQSRETLIKSSISSRFSLVKERNGKSYCIVRQDPGNLTILDANGKSVVTNPYLGMNPVVVRYYDFGAGSVYYSLTDQLQNLTYIYDESGALLTSPPVESSSCDLQPSKSGKVTAYLTYKGSLMVKPLP
ncbi:MAG TPA: hypothetical protein VKZ86_10380 [Cyclobacteriaceae bacterium]|nr:hypothetical protein [Cyclobacteriaceae bacterium]